MPVTDTEITAWSTTPTDNSPSRSDPVGGLLGAQFRNVRSVVRAESENKQWVRLAYAPTYVSATSFSVPGDRRTDFAVGRRVKLTLSGGTKYGTILSRNFAGGVTTVNVRLDLERYPQSHLIVDHRTIRYLGFDATATFVPTTIVEFADPDTGIRMPARVETATFASFLTTIVFEEETLPSLTVVFPDAVMVPSAGIDNTVSEVQLGAFTTALPQSGWADTVMAGSFEITSDNTAGPFVVALPWRQSDSDYVPQVQPTGSSDPGAPTVWTFPMVASRNTTAFAVTFASAINTGFTLTYDFAILRGQP